MAIDDLDPMEEEEPTFEDNFEGAEEGDVAIPQDATVVIEKNDRSVRELFTWHNEHELNLHPDWQGLSEISCEGFEIAI